MQICIINQLKNAITATFNVLFKSLWKKMYKLTQGTVGEIINMQVTSIRCEWFLYLTKDLVNTAPFPRSNRNGFQRHTIKPGLAPFFWPGLKVGLASILAPTLAPNKFLAWLQKLAWPQFWPLKKSLASNLKIFFFLSNFIFTQLLIHLKY